RLAIVSFGVRHLGDHLHANFVVAVLSDLFGIQARSGCFCAGPYLHRMYAIDELWSARMEAEVAKGNAGAKLAFTRISFNYFISETVFDYIVEAVHLIARDGWKLLPLYRFDPVTGLWQHRSRAPEDRPSLRDVLASGRRQMESAPESVLPAQLKTAREIVAGAQAGPPGTTLDDPQLSEEFEQIRWFPLPGEGLQRLRADGPHTRIRGSHGT